MKINKRFIFLALFSALSVLLGISGLKSMEEEGQSVMPKQLSVKGVPSKKDPNYYFKMALGNLERINESRLSIPINLDENYLDNDFYKFTNQCDAGLDSIKAMLKKLKKIGWDTAIILLDEVINKYAEVEDLLLLSDYSNKLKAFIELVMVHCLNEPLVIAQDDYCLNKALDLACVAIQVDRFHMCLREESAELLKSKNIDEQLQVALKKPSLARDTCLLWEAYYLITGKLK